MADLLVTGYPWIKAFHIMAVIAWMAGLFYLPRLYVYHVEQVGSDGQTHDMFQTMERRLLKAAAVLGMTWFHHWLGRRRKDFMEGTNGLTGRQYRMMNEVPTVLMVVIVLSVVVKF